MSHGKICYLEIPATTGEASAQFYQSIFGWKVRTRGDGELAFDDPGGVSGTWVKESDRTPDEQTRIYIMVDAIDETLPGLRIPAAALSRHAEKSVRAWVRSRYSLIRWATNSVCMKSHAGSEPIKMKLA